MDSGAIVKSKIQTVRQHAKAKLLQPEAAERNNGESMKNDSLWLVTNKEQRANRMKDHVGIQLKRMNAAKIILKG